MTGTEIYKRTPGYEREAPGIRLHAPQWRLLLAFDGQRSLAEVALSAEVSFSEALPLTDQFLGQGWIEEQPITLDQYLKRTGATSLSAVGSAVPPPVVLHEPRSAATETKPEPPVPAALPAPAVMEETTPAFKAPTPITSTASAPPPVPLVRPRGPLRIKAVVDHIISQVGNNALGQLVVYRVFLRVPPQLLQAEDIASVHLVNDSGVVKTAVLQKAIADSVLEVLKRPLPNNL